MDQATSTPANCISGLPTGWRSQTRVGPGGNAKTYFLSSHNHRLVSRCLSASSFFFLCTAISKFFSYRILQIPPYEYFVVEYSSKERHDQCQCLDCNVDWMLLWWELIWYSALHGRGSCYILHVSILIALKLSRIRACPCGILVQSGIVDRQ